MSTLYGTVNEAYLSYGSQPSQGSTTQHIALDPGFTVQMDSSWIQTGIATGIFTKTAGYGVLTYNSNIVRLDYTLTNNVNHSSSGPDVTVAQVTLVETATGIATSNVPVIITVLDDSPSVTVDTSSHNVTAASSVVTGWVELKGGADGGNETATSISFDFECSYPSAGSRMESVTLAKDGTPLVLETMTGQLELVYDNAQGKILYTFSAAAGLQGYSETFTFQFADNDGDRDYASVDMNFLENLTFRGASVTVDEGALFGDGSSQGADSVVLFSLEPSLVLQGVQSVDLQGPANPSQYKADANGDGIYTEVVWENPEPGVLIGTAEGEAVIRLEAVFQGGLFQGQINSTLLKPFQHNGVNVDNDILALDITLTQYSNAASASVGLTVNILDDSPFRAAQDATAIIDVFKTAAQAQSVYVVLDVSGSVNPYEAANAIAAIKNLAQSYIDNGVDAVMSLVTFMGSANTVYSSITPQEMIDWLEWSRFKGKCGSNFEASLNQTIQLMEADQANPAYADRHQSLYFISDGQMNCGDKYLRTWTSYRDSRGDELDVFALCIQSKAIHPAMVLFLTNVTGDYDNFYHVSNYSGMLEQAVGLGKTATMGNLLGNVGSADFTSIDEVLYNGKTYIVDADGVDISLASGVVLHLSQNGDYTVKSGKASLDVIEGLTLRMHDADGDTVEVAAALMFREAPTETFSNLAQTNVYNESGWLTNFYDIAAPMTNGAYAFTKMGVCGAPILPSINGYSSGDYAAKFKPARYGDLKLEALLGGASGVADLFQDLGVIQQPYGYNSIVSLNIAEGTGEVVFNWAFQPGKSTKYYDAAFWVLKDASGNVVDQGLLHQSGDGKWHTGIATVAIADTSKAYTLHIVQQELGKDSACPNSTLWLKDVIYFTEVDFRSAGNVLTDASPDGSIDILGAADQLSSIWYNNVEYVINGETTIIAASGTLTIRPDGTYLFVAHDPDARDNIQEDFLYVVTNAQGEEVTSFLHVRSEDRIIRGTEGDDLIDRSTEVSDNTLLLAGDGNDEIIGGAGVDFLYGGSGNDTITADQGDYAYGGNGDDLIYGEAGFAALYGGDGNDTIHVDGAGGAAYGGAGNDVLYGTEGGGTLYGGDGDDTIWGGGSANLMHGDAGHDVLMGGAGNDTLYGGWGNDVLNGEEGNDLLFGGSGINRLTGGEGADTFAWNSDGFGGMDTILDFNSNEGDKLSFGDLIAAGTTLDDFFDAYTANLSIDSADRILSFDITGSAIDKQVEIHFQGDDVRFDQAAVEYANAANSAAELQALHELLFSMTA